MAAGEKRERIHSLDAMRGLSILLMVVHHAMLDLNGWYGILGSMLSSTWLQTVRLAVVCLFILLSGASTQFSHSNRRRGLQMLAFALVITLVTYLYNPDYFIVFGILHFLGAAALIYSVLGDRMRLPVWLLAALFVVSYWLLVGKDYPVEHLWLLGITSPRFASSDYFPLFPWLFLYAIGIHWGKQLTARRGPRWIYQLRCRPLEAVGKRTLWVYLLHQPVLFALHLLFERIAA